MSVEGRAPLVDFCNRFDPRAPPRDLPNPAHGARSRLRMPQPDPSAKRQGAGRHVRRAEARGQRRVTEHVPGQPRGHGPGARPGLHPVSRPPPRSLAVEASPQPDRLEHLMSQTRGSTGWRGPPRRTPEGVLGRICRACFRLRGSSPLGSPHAHPREGECDPPHPRCLPSSNCPLWGLGPYSPDCPQSVESGPAPFRSSRPSPLRQDAR